MIWTLLIAGCSAADLKGHKPTIAISVPEFSALSETGAPRSRADLIGHPTVLWFFPVVGTPG